MPAFTSALFSLAQFKSTTCGDGDPSLFFRPCVVNFLVQGACCQIGNTARNGLAADSPTQDDGGRLSITISGGKVRKLLILGLFLLAVGVVPVRAQEYPKAEVFGGYQYVRLNPGGTNCQGFGGAAAANVSNWLGVAGDFGYCKVTGLPSGISAHAVNYMFGPRVTYRSYGSLTPFAHVLFGGQHFGGTGGGTDRKSTRLNSSHSQNPHAAFCLKKNITLHAGRADDAAQDPGVEPAVHPDEHVLERGHERTQPHILERPPDAAVRDHVRRLSGHV